MNVYIREPSISDVKEFVEKSRSSLALHRPWVFPPTTPAAYRAYVDRLEDPRYEGYFVCRKSDDAIVGVANLSEIIRGAMDGAFVGYWAFDGFQGKGYMTEGLSLVFDRAFEGLGLHRLEVNIQPANTASIALAHRLGLTKEGFSPKYLKIGGEWRDHERWAIVEEDWINRGGSLWVANRSWEAQS
jgi:ribosomal-protein-alanine N-acetyltransferase